MNKIESLNAKAAQLVEAQSTEALLKSLAHLGLTPSGACCCPCHPKRPEYCCGVCPEIGELTGSGYDCTCRYNPRCPNFRDKGADNNG